MTSTQFTSMWPLKTQQRNQCRTGDSSRSTEGDVQQWCYKGGCIGHCVTTADCLYAPITLHIAQQAEEAIVHPLSPFDSNFRSRPSIVRQGTAIILFQSHCCSIMAVYIVQYTVDTSDCNVSIVTLCVQAEEEDVAAQ